MKLRCVPELSTRKGELNTGSLAFIPPREAYSLANPASEDVRVLKLIAPSPDD